MINLVHCTTADQSEGVKIYCGCGKHGTRLLASPLGNIFHNQRTHPGSTLPQYRKWLKEKAADPKSAQTKLLRKILSLHSQGFNIYLTCHCQDTSTCHCTVIKNVVEAQLRREELAATQAAEAEQAALAAAEDAYSKAAKAKGKRVRKPKNPAWPVIE